MERQCCKYFHSFPGRILQILIGEPFLYVKYFQRYPQPPHLNFSVDLHWSQWPPRSASWGAEICPWAEKLEPCLLWTEDFTCSLSEKLCVIIQCRKVRFRHRALQNFNFVNFTLITKWARLHVLINCIWVYFLSILFNPFNSLTASKEMNLYAYK